jgi:hypothetical protein
MNCFFNLKKLDRNYFLIKIRLGLRTLQRVGIRQRPMLQSYINIQNVRNIKTR